MIKEDVRHLPEEHRFEFATEAGRAILDYTEDGQTWHFAHTYVPPEMRGQGAAAVVVKHALNVARNEGRKVAPDCSYVEAYIARHPEYGDLVARR